MPGPLTGVRSPWTLASLAAAPRGGLRRLFAGAPAPAPDDLLGAAYRVVARGPHALWSGGRFERRFYRNPSGIGPECQDDNVSDGRRHGALTDHGAVDFDLCRRDVESSPHRRLREQLVMVHDGDPTLLLGRCTLRLGPWRLPAGWTLLERASELRWQGPGTPCEELPLDD